jgi:hypothetical protein
MITNDRTYTLDANLIVIEGDTKVSSGFAGLPSVIDFGRNGAVVPVQEGRTDAVMVVDVTALDPALASGNVCLGEMTMGKGTSIDGINMADSVIGRYEIGFCNVAAAAYYQYVGVYVIVGGTTPAITYTAFAAHRAQP